MLISYTCRDCGEPHEVSMADDAPTFRVEGCPNGAPRASDDVEPVPLPIPEDGVVDSLDIDL